MSSPTAVEHVDHGKHSDHHPQEGVKDEFGEATNGKIAMWFFLLSDAFSFGGLLLAYGIARGGAEVWKHTQGMAGWTRITEPTLGINFTALLTFILICSSVTMVLAYAAALEGNRKQALLFLGITILGGWLFLAGQYHEYWGIWHPGLTKQGLTFGASAYASTFYLITAFHGLHVLTGTLYMCVIFIQTLRGKTDADDFEIVGLFWHFVDLVWILVFTFIYLV